MFDYRFKLRWRYYWSLMINIKAQRSKADYCNFDFRMSNSKSKSQAIFPQEMWSIKYISQGKCTSIILSIIYLCFISNNTEKISTHFQLHYIAKIILYLLYSIFTETDLNHFQQFAEERDVRSKQAIIGSYKEEIWLSMLLCHGNIINEHQTKCV